MTDVMRYMFLSRAEAQEALNRYFQELVEKLRESELFTHVTPSSTKPSVTLRVLCTNPHVRQVSLAMTVFLRIEGPEEEKGALQRAASRVNVITNKEGVPLLDGNGDPIASQDVSVSKSEVFDLASLKQKKLNAWHRVGLQQIIQYELAFFAEFEYYEPKLQCEMPQSVTNTINEDLSGYENILGYARQAIDFYSTRDPRPDPPDPDKKKKRSVVALNFKAAIDEDE